MYATACFRVGFTRPKRPACRSSHPISLSLFMCELQDAPHFLTIGLIFPPAHPSLLAPSHLRGRRRDSIIAAIGRFTERTRGNGHFQKKREDRRKEWNGVKIQGREERKRKKKRNFNVALFGAYISLKDERAIGETPSANVHRKASRKLCSLRPASLPRKSRSDNFAILF